MKIDREIDRLKIGKDILPNQHAAMSCDSVGDRSQISLCRYRQNRQNGQSKIDIQISEDNIQLDRYCVDICTYIFRKKMD